MKDPFSTDLEILPIKRKLLEKDVQSTCVKWARSRGWWARKFSSPANRSVPDYIFGKDGCTIFVEFKAPGKLPTEAQLEEHKAMAEVGLSVHVIDDVAKFKSLFGEWEKQIANSVYVNQMLEEKKP